MAETSARINLNYNVSGNAIDALRELVRLQKELAAGVGPANQGINRTVLGAAANYQRQATSTGGGGGGMGGGGGGALVPYSGGPPGSGGGNSSVAAVHSIISLPRLMQQFIAGQNTTNSILRSMLLNMSGGGGMGGGGGRGRGPSSDRDYEGLRGLVRRYGGPLGVLMSSFPTSSTIGAAGIGVGSAMLTNFLAQQGLQSGASFANAANRGDLSPEAQARHMGESLPIVGRVLSSIREFVDAIDGTTERIRRSMVDISRGHVIAQTSGQIEMSRFTGAGDLAGAKMAAMLAGGASPVPFHSFDRGTVEGQMLFQEQQRRMPHLLQIAAQERRVAAARARVSGLQSGLHANQARLADLERKRQIHLGNLQGFVGPHALEMEPTGQGGVGGAQWPVDPIIGMALENRDQAANHASQAMIINQEMEAGQRNRLQMINQIRAAESAAAQEERRHREMIIGLMREDINILQQREQMLSQTAQRLGAMNPIQRRLGVMAAEQIAQHGMGNVPWFMIQHAQSVAPNLIGREAERFGESTPEFQTLRRLGEFGPETRSLSELRAAIDQLSRNLNLETLETETQYSNRILESIDDHLGTAVAILIELGGTQLHGVNLNAVVQNLSTQN
jgi:hypothetical protein